ncbi:MAG TPA: molybdenum cofactor guanylyltransferase [Dehalococcoidia bacterium]|nr:molybdenum cofactor guanylyltransferase [Dehalococcoidia bacterium]
MNGPDAVRHGAAIILAGGKSTRFGRDKAGEDLLGRSLLQRALDAFEGLVDEYVIVRAVGQALPAVTAGGIVTTVEDLYPESGPLGGIYTGLSVMQAPIAAVVACDMPLLRPALLQELLRLVPQSDIVVPLNEGMPEPLCAAYSKRCLEPIRQRLDAGAFKVTGFYDQVSTNYLQPADWRPFDPEGLSFQNLNRESDLARIEALLREQDWTRKGQDA